MRFLLLILLLFNTKNIYLKDNSNIIPFKIRQITFSILKNNNPKIPANFLKKQEFWINVFIQGFYIRSSMEIDITGDLEFYKNKKLLYKKENAFIMKKPIKNVISIIKLNCMIKPPQLKYGKYQVKIKMFDHISKKNDTLSKNFYISKNANWIENNLKFPFSKYSLCFSKTGKFNKNNISQIFFKGVNCIILKVKFQKIKKDTKISLKWKHEKSDNIILEHNNIITPGTIEKNYIMYSKKYAIPSGKYNVSFWSNNKKIKNISFNIISSKYYGDVK